jgi:hypothetical protein
LSFFFFSSRSHVATYLSNQQRHMETTWMGAVNSCCTCLCLQSFVFDMRGKRESVGGRGKRESVGGKTCLCQRQKRGSLLTCLCQRQKRGSLLSLT